MGKTFRNLAIGIIILTIASYALIVLIVGKAADVVQKQHSKMESYVGKKYIVDNDTVVVIDFSYVEGTVKIRFKDNTKDEVSPEYLKTLKEVK